MTKKPFDHLWKLLFDGPASGENSLDGWDLRVGSATDPRVARMVSLHESFHSQLNDSSGMGTLLHGLSWVARHRPKDEARNALLRGLLGRCHRVHEAYATWLSLLVVGRGAPAVDLLEGNPRYRALFNLADGLTGDLRGGYLRYHAVAAGLRACMQGEDLKIAVERGLEHLQISALPASRSPDALLRQLRASIAPDHWSRAFAAARAQRPDLPGWELIAESERDPALFEETLQADFDETSSWLMTCFHEAARSALPRDAGITDFNGHLPFVQPLIEAAERLLPPGPVRLPLRAAGPGETPEAEVVRVFQGERLLVRDPPLTAHLIGALDEVDPQHLVCGEGSLAHLFLWAAAGRRWRQQQRWPADAPPDDDAPFTALRRVLAAGERRELYVCRCDDAEALSRAHQALGGQVPIIAAVSMATYGDDAWCDAWLTPLRDITLFAVLVDLDPFSHFDLWAQSDGPDFAYAVIELPDEHVPSRVFALKPDGARHLFLVPCMPLLVSAMLHYLREVVPRPARFRAETGFLAAADRAAVSVLLGHLLGEEHVFDFSAGRLHRRGQQP